MDIVNIHRQGGGPLANTLSNTMPKRYDQIGLTFQLHHILLNCLLSQIFSDMNMRYNKQTIK